MRWSGVTATGTNDAASVNVVATASVSVVDHSGGRSAAPVAVRAETRARPSARVWFVDALRLVAAFQMLQGHTLAALLAPEVRHGAWYTTWSNVRGLTSVAFLFTAGMALYFAIARDFASQSSSGASARRSVRALRLVALGYLLHAPLPALLMAASVSPGELRELEAVDVLQCIGVSLLLLELARLCAPSLRVWLFLVGCGAVVFALGTPWAHQWAEHAQPRAAATYLGPVFGSQFPLWPWTTHLFAGVLAAAWIARAPASAGVRLALLAAALLGAGRLLVQLGSSGVVIDHMYRLGWVACVAAGLAWLMRGARKPAPWILALATESLFLYVFHVLLVYGRPWGLAAWLGPRLDAPAALAAALGVVALSCSAALGYRRLRSLL